MKEELVAEIAELQCVHRGLTAITRAENATILSGPLPFEASANGHSTIAECFEIELTIPDDYPENLPRVRETGGKIDSDYDHLNGDGTLCLGIPIEKHRIFWQQPSLLGFVNRLLIPYFFGYCHYKKYGTHPFGEAEHGAVGIVQHYMDTLELADECTALAVIVFLVEHGYRGHHPCPCGSGKKVRKCHGQALRDLHKVHTARTLQNDFDEVLDVCIAMIKSENLQIPEPLDRQIWRILNKMSKR